MFLFLSEKYILNCLKGEFCDKDILETYIIREYVFFFNEYRYKIYITDDQIENFMNINNNNPVIYDLLAYYLIFSIYNNKDNSQIKYLTKFIKNNEKLMKLIKSIFTSIITEDISLNPIMEKLRSLTR